MKFIKINNFLFYYKQDKINKILKDYKNHSPKFNKIYIFEMVKI